MNVLLADHHPIFRHGIKSMMKKTKQFNVIGKIKDGSNIAVDIDKHSPQLLIMEIDLPHLNGVSSIKKIRALFPNLKILILSSHPEEIYAISCVKAGANGYISKTNSSKKIKKAILTVMDGKTYLSKDVEEAMKKKRKYIRNDEKTVYQYRKLSAREIEVLNLLSKGKRNKEISKVLDINEKTVSTYKTRLLKKLNADNIAELIEQARLLQSTS